VLINNEVKKIDTDAPAKRDSVTDSNESKVKSAIRIFLFSLQIDDSWKIAQYGRSSPTKENKVKLNAI